MISRVDQNKKIMTQMRKFFSQNLDCKLVSDKIKDLTKNYIKSANISPKITVIMSLDKYKNPNPASEVYVNKKLGTMPELGIKSDLIKVDPSISKKEMDDLINKLNQDPENTSTIIQLPFNSDYNFDIHDSISKIKDQKNVDGFSPIGTQQPNLLNPKTLKPPTALGIATLLSYYGIETEGKKIAILGKGTLVGYPLLKMLSGYPYYATVTACDIFTQGIKDITKDADIVISACGQAEFLKHQDIKENVILIDAGINPLPISKSSTLIPQKKILKRKITGDISKEAYHKSKYYTPVPGGVGLLTVASLAANVLNSYLIQNNLPIIDLEKKLRFNHKLNSFLKNLEYKTKNLNVLLISSAYNGLTQKIERSLIGQGYTVGFQIASSAQAMRAAVDRYNPDIIICPTLMKAIPEDIYKKVKCLIVHPGIKGDRGPSSLDWAILNGQQEWGVTLLQADKEMDAGDIWASENFGIKKGQSKIQIYNKSVGTVAERLVIDTLQTKFINELFKPEKLDYSNPSIRGNLHRPIKFSDEERTVDWNTNQTALIMKKSLAAETQPGLKVKIMVNDKEFTCFSYGYVEEKNISPPSNTKIGQVFSRKLEAICVKTIDGAVWIKQLRRLKSKDEPFPFKVPATFHLGEKNLSNVQKIDFTPLEEPNAGTFQEITFQQVGSIGILGFDIYNGAMSTAQCLRLTESLKKISKIKDVKVLVLKGCLRNWSNGINLNVIQNASDPQAQAWDNIQAINEVVKAIIRMNDKITISAIQTNAGAGGVYLGLATDLSFAADGVVLNPHYKKMGLYGSQLHTVTAERTFGYAILQQLKESTRPMLVSEAIELGLLNELVLRKKEEFLDRVFYQAEQLANNEYKFKQMIVKKNEKAKMLFKYKSIEEYEREELEEMRKDIFQDRNGFAEKRWLFVTKQTKDIVACNAF